MSTTRVQYRPWRKYKPYHVEERRWLPWPSWQKVDEHGTYEEAFRHAASLATDGETKKMFRGRSSWTPV